MMLNIKMGHWKLFLFSFLFIPLTEVCSQLNPGEALAKYRDTFPEESGIVSEYQRVITIARDNDSLDIRTREYREILVLDKPSRWVKEKVYSNSFSEVQDLEAFTLLPGKRKYKNRIEVEEFKRSYDKDTYIFFDDTEVINFNFPQLTEGAKVVTDYTLKSHDPHVVGNFYFSSYVPTLHAKFKIIAEKGVSVNHGLFNDSLVSISFSEETLKDGSKVYTYEASDLPKIDNEKDNPGFGYLSASAYLTIASYENSRGEKVPVLSSLDDLHAWYRTFVDTLTIDESLKELTQSIVNQDDDELEKVRKIFYWVQENIKYIAFEDGMRGFIPHPAKYVLDKRYGDCKDMTSLLVGLLRSEGISAKYTWIGSRTLPFKYSEISSPLVDNHMIASVFIDGQTIFLDATGNYSPLGFPTAMIQGKESLISSGEDYRIETVPVVSKEKNQAIDTSFLKLENGTLFGNGKLRLSGLSKVDHTYRLIQKTSKGEENYLRELLKRGSNKFLLDNFSIKNVDDPDAPIEIEYQFNIADYYSSIGDELYINLCLDRTLTDLEIMDRKTPLENDFKFVSSSTAVLEIPDGYQLSYLPEGKKANSSKLGFTIDYQVSRRTITVRSVVYFDFLLLYPSEFDAWNQVIEAYSMATRKTIVLKKNS